jgi:hypothetical protein
MLIELRETLKVEALVNLLEKQREFFSAHENAELAYVGGGKHTVVISVMTVKYRGEGECYEDALAEALEDAMCEDITRRLRGTNHL